MAAVGLGIEVVGASAASGQFSVLSCRVRMPPAFAIQMDYQMPGCGDALLPLSLKRARPVGFDTRPPTRAGAEPVPFRPRPKAIRNLGNTCYMNCVLQALLSCEILTSWFLSGPVPHHAQPSKVSEKAEAAHAVLAAMVRPVQCMLKCRCVALTLSVSPAGCLGIGKRATSANA